MTVLAWPAGFDIARFTLRMHTNQRVNAAPFGGSEQAVDMLADRWLAAVDLAPCTPGEAAAREAFLWSFRGQVNTVGLWHLKRPEPRGTLRGTPTLSAAAVQGASSISVAAAGAATLLQGDLVGVGGLLLMVASDCAASGGVIVVPLVNRLRKALSSGAAVTWDRPMAQFRLLSAGDVEFLPGYAGATSLEFGEAIGA